MEILDRNKTSDYGFEVPTDTFTTVYPTVKPTIPAFQQITGKEDVEDFFAEFEGHMTSHGIEPDEWTKYLAPTLTADANSTSIRMNTADCVDYEKVKEKLLGKYLVTQDTYTQRLDQFTRKMEKTGKNAMTDYTTSTTNGQFSVRTKKIISVSLLRIIWPR